ncbi:amino acid transporter, putative, partial [Entamoeba invadens IP1]|uniref:amino acid transporter, putative n=1 Tax=Entamoeba invadens IP1 TaxID=370355 RepID=UPI0002C3E923
MSKAVITSNLDSETLSKTVEKGCFEPYNERFIQDGVHDLPNEEESVDLQFKKDSDPTAGSAVASQTEVSTMRSSIIRRLRKTDTKQTPSPTQPLADTKDTDNKDIQTNENGVHKDDEIDEEEIKKLQNSKEGKGFTVEDVIARNFQELLLEEKEYSRLPNGKMRRNAKTNWTIAFKSLHFGFSLVGSLIGAGILSLALTCSKMGVVGFVAWNILTIVYFIYTWFYFNKAIYLTGAATLGELLSLVFGNAFAIIVDVCNTLFFICVLMSDQVIATQYIFGIIQDTTTRDQWNNTLDQCYGKPQQTAGIACGWHYIILYLVAVILNFPLIIPRSVKFLSRISTLTLVSGLVTTFSILGKLIYSVAAGKSSNGSDENFPTFNGKLWPPGFMSFFTMAPFISANFQVHSCLPPLYVGTKGMSKKTKLVSLQAGSVISIITTVIFYLIVAISGDVSFDKVSGNVLNDFSNPNKTDIDWIILICRALMIVVVCVAYPIIMYPTCAGIIRYIPRNWKFMQIWNGTLSILVIRILILCLSTLCASFVTNIGVIFSVGAAIFSIFVVYIGPLSIIMLWPRIEKLGDPNFRKLSIWTT